MAEQNPIRYSDLIQPDDSIEKLIKQLEELQETYKNMITTVKRESAQLGESLKGMSGATDKGRAGITQAHEQASKLEKAYRDLSFAESEAAKKLAELKEAQKESNDLNKLTVKLNQSAEGSYNRLSAQYSINKIYLNNMTKEERKNTEEGRKLEKQTRAIYEEMKKLQESTGKMSLNVGNYEGAIENAIGVQSKWYTGLKQIGDLFEGGFTNGLKSAGSAVGAFGKQLLGLLMNPIVGTIAAITVAFMALSKGISSSSENTETLNRILIPFRVILGKIVEGLQAFAGWILKGVEGVESLAMSVSKFMERIPGLGQYFQRFNNSVERNIALSRQKQVEDKKEAKTQESLTRTVQKSTAVRISSYKDEAEARQRLLDEQRSKEKDAIRQAEDAKYALMENEYDKQRAQVTLQYNRQIEDLKERLEKEKNLTEAARAAINETITSLEQQKQRKLADIFDKETESYRKAQDKQKELQEKQRQDALKYTEDISGTYEERRTREIQAEVETIDGIIQAIEEGAIKVTDKELGAIRKRKDQLIDEAKDIARQVATDILDDAMRTLNGIRIDFTQPMEATQQLTMAIWKLKDAFIDGKLEDKISSVNNLFQIATEALNQYAAAQERAAAAAVSAAEKEVEAAQSALDKEIEARNNGYANDVQMARKELEQKKKVQQQAVKEQQKAQKQQEAIQTLQQISNLVTATALIWSQMGFPWAIPAIAVMWGSFAASKAMAASIAGTGEEEKYAEGTVELLQGGSHQSGNDIDLGRKKNGTRRRAEGGEFLAVINKRNSRRYRDIIPNVINSLNDGTFADKFLNAYDGGGRSIIATGSSANLSKLEEGVDRINTNLEKPHSYTDGNGNTVVQYKNVKRTIRK